MTESLAIAVAMSGGVDSSVAAAQLVAEGHRVFGLMLRLSAPGPSARSNRCCSPRDMDAARDVARLLGIPFYVVDAQAAFHSEVVRPFVRGYAKGITPNPCLNCNARIRWGFLLDHVLAMGATHLATGHYARIQALDGQIRLLRAADRDKDQSYVLAVLSQDQLRRTLLPLGALTKREVRELARLFQLPVADRAESQDLCFLGGGDYRAFLRAEAPEVARPGPLTDEAGQVLGSHTGLADYTIGQRKGLGPLGSHPLYVLRKEPATNTLVVAPRQRLERREFTTAPAHWVSGAPPPAPVRAMVRVRYRSKEVSGLCSPLPGGAIRILLDVGMPDVTPGQFAAIYQGEACLGGGEIAP